MKKKILIYIPTGLNSPELEILISKAQDEINNKHEIIILGHIWPVIDTINVFQVKPVIALKHRCPDDLTCVIFSSLVIGLDPEMANEARNIMKTIIELKKSLNLSIFSHALYEHVPLLLHTIDGDQTKVSQKIS